MVRKRRTNSETGPPIRLGNMDRFLGNLKTLLNAKLEKSSTGNRVYITNGAGGQANRPYSITPTANAFPT